MPRQEKVTKKKATPVRRFPLRSSAKPGAAQLALRAQTVLASLPPFWLPHLAAHRGSKTPNRRKLFQLPAQLLFASILLRIYYNSANVSVGPRVTPTGTEGHWENMTFLHNYHYRSSRVLESYVAQAEKDEMKALRDALGLSPTESNFDNVEDLKKTYVRGIVTAIESAGGNSIVNLIRGGGVSYLEMLNDIAKQFRLANTLPSYQILNIEIPEIRAINDDDAMALIRSHTEDFENRIVAEFLRRAYERMNPDERMKFDDALERTLESRGISPGQKLAGAAGIMAVANMGGFATYTLVSSVLSAMSFGTLGFGAYTFASSLLHVLIGPVGWIALASYGATWLGRPDQKKCLSVIVLIAMLRQRIAKS